MSVGLAGIGRVIVAVPFPAQHPPVGVLNTARGSTLRKHPGIPTGARLRGSGLPAHEVFDAPTASRAMLAPSAWPQDTPNDPFPGQAGPAVSEITGAIPPVPGHGTPNNVPIAPENVLTPAPKNWM